jgi:hypothetical protein
MGLHGLLEGQLCLLFYEGLSSIIPMYALTLISAGELSYHTASSSDYTVSMMMEVLSQNLL